MSDLKEALEKSFRDAFNDDSVVRELYGKIRQGKATHKDVLRFAERVGQLVSLSFQENTSEEMFPSGKMQQEMVDSIIGLLRLDHEIVTEATTIVQEKLNQDAGIGLKAVEPKMDLDRAQGLGQNVAEQETYSKATSRMESGAVNFSQHTVDEHLKENVRFQWKAGMSPKIVRKADSGACKWCRDLAGVYDYADIKNTGNDVFRRHENCGCTVEYIADGKKAQDVWSKATYRRDDASDRVNSIKRIGEVRQKKQALQLKERTARAEAIRRVQSELGYSGKSASIWYNQNKGYIDRYGLDYMLNLSWVYDKQTKSKIMNLDTVENPMDFNKYQKMVTNLKRNGIKVFEAKGDDLRFLQYMNAEATYDNGIIMHIGPIPSASAFYEEIIHSTQAKLYGELQSTDLRELFAREVAANRKLLENAEFYGFDEIDIDDIEKNLAMWEDKFERAVGVKYGEDSSYYRGFGDINR